MSNLNNHYPMLFACCLPVKGARQAILCDVQRQIYQYIPISVYAVLTEHEGKTLAAIKETYDNEHDAIIDEYFDILVKEEWAFFTSTPLHFPKMDLHWEEPTPLTNAIIDISEDIGIDFNNLFEQFSELGCEHLQIRCFMAKSLKYFQSILDTIQNKRIISVDFVIMFQKEWQDTTLLMDFCGKNTRIASLSIYNAPTTKNVYIAPENMGHIFFGKEIISAENHCGKISDTLFSINIKTFTEAQQNNTCLNRKISIDKEGYIKNCPSMKQHYGNIRDTTLQQALEHPDFKKDWTVHKDQIKICKDCEFRYICTDCRAYVEDPQDRYSKPLKCGYNPYTCEWEEWSTNPLKQKAIDYYNLRPIL
jgi:SPASM domain peptide maturase of grasp-with-spasm system